MQDWLAERQLDRRVLETLARNAAEVEEWREHEAAQGAWGEEED
jgi:hypothetical protein